MLDRITSDRIRSHRIISDRNSVAAQTEHAPVPAPAHESMVEELDLVSVGMALRDFCLDQVLHVDVALSRHAHPHRGVHEARKGIRRLRSAIALGAPGFGVAATKIDRALQRLGRSLSSLRDAHVAVELARRRAKRATDPTLRATWRYASAALERVRTKVLHRELSDDAEFAMRRAALARCARQIMRLAWRSLDTTTLSAQLAYSRKRADRVAARIDDDTSLVQLHRVRRRLRRHRMQVSALTALLDPQANPPVHAAPGFRASVTAYASTYEELSARVDTLGARLDRSLLRDALRDLARGRERKAALAALRNDAG